MDESFYSPLLGKTKWREIKSRPYMVQLLKWNAWKKKYSGNEVKDIQIEMWPGPGNNCVKPNNVGLGGRFSLQCLSLGSPRPVNAVTSVYKCSGWSCAKWDSVIPIHLTLNECLSHTWYWQSTRCRPYDMKESWKWPWEESNCTRGKVPWWGYRCAAHVQEECHHLWLESRRKASWRR